MSNSYRIDQHKLMFHPQRVAEWQQGHDDWEKAKKIYPIYMEISPVGHCNHRCVFCAKDYLGYQKREIPFDRLKNAVSEMAKNGVKSLNFAGEGEPLLYKNLPEIIEHCENVGIDSSLTTNFSITDEKSLEIYVKYCKWIKVSLNAGSAEVYAQIHRTKEDDFNRVLENLKKSVEIRNHLGKGSTLGAQMLLLPENFQTAAPLAKKLQEIGIDYLVIKPYSQHLSSITTEYKDISYSDFMYLEKELEKYNTKTFNVIFRANTMKKLENTLERYEKCGAVPFFWGYIMSDGSVFGCSNHITNPDFCYGNINENSFSEIWESDRRKANFEYIQNTMNSQNCRLNCRMDEINRYLNELENPSPHVNFI